MTWLLDRYLDLWNWFLTPARWIIRGVQGVLAEINIPLIGDFIKVFVLCAGLAVLGIYVGVFSLVAPVSYFLLGTAVAAVLLRWLSRRWIETRPIMSAWFGGLSTLSGWSSIGFLILTCAYGWLIYVVPGQIEPAQFAQYEAIAVDATAELRRYVTPTTALIVVGVMAALTLAIASYKPLLAAGAINRGATAVLSVFAVLASYTIVVSEDSSERHARIVGQIMPHLRENIDATVRDRQEVAALRWITHELSYRAPADRSMLFRALAALQESTQRICAEEQAQFHAAYAVARQAHMEATYEEVEDNSAAAAQDYCNTTHVAAAGMRSLVHVSMAIEAPPVDQTIWVDDVLDDVRPELRRAAMTGAAGPTISIQELRALDARITVTAGEAGRAKAIVRNALLDYAANLIGPEYRGVMGQILDSLQSAVIQRLGTVTHIRFVELWAPRTPTTVLGDEVAVRTRSADVELVRWQDAHPPGAASSADDVARAAWNALRPSGGVVMAAEAAVVAAAASALAARGVRARPGAPRGRIPRIRI
jgi:hypothetical protein